MKGIAFALLVLFPSSVSAFIVEDGKAHGDVTAAMKAAGYPEAGLEIGGGVGRRVLMWTVEEGVLVVGYSSETGVVSGVSFWIMDERPKKHRMTVTYSVKRFDTTTGEMVIITKKPK